MHLNSFYLFLQSTMREKDGKKEGNSSIFQLWPINVDFTTSKGSLVHSREFSFIDFVCVFLSDLLLISAVIFPEKRKGMSSSDSVSLSTSSSESTESGRSRGWCNIPREYYLKINIKINNCINSHLDKSPNAGKYLKSLK